jgi:hypothetical protein
MLYKVFGAYKNKSSYNVEAALRLSVNLCLYLCQRQIQLEQWRIYIQQRVSI